MTATNNELEDRVMIAMYMGAQENGGSTLAKDGTWAKFYEVQYGKQSWATEQFSDKETPLGIYSPNELLYNSDWNWIILVYQKVLEDMIEIADKSFSTVSTEWIKVVNANNSALISAASNGEIQTLYTQMVEAIKWINEINKDHGQQVDNTTNT